MHPHEPGQLFVRIPKSYFGTKDSSITNRNCAMILNVFYTPCPEWPDSHQRPSEPEHLYIGAMWPSSSVTGTGAGHPPTLHQHPDKISQTLKVTKKFIFEQFLVSDIHCEAVFRTAKVCFLCLSCINFLLGLLLPICNIFCWWLIKKHFLSISDDFFQNSATHPRCEWDRFQFSFVK